MALLTVGGKVLLAGGKPVNAPSGGATQEKSVTITENGTTTITPDTPYDAMSKVDVKINVAGKGLKTKTITVTHSMNMLLQNYTVEHNCGVVPAYVLISSSNTNATYLTQGWAEYKTNTFMRTPTNGSYRAVFTDSTLTFTVSGSSYVRYVSGTRYSFTFVYESE